MSSAVAVERPSAGTPSHPALGHAVTLVWPTVALGLGFLVPFALLLQVSVAHRDPGGLWSPGFEATHYLAFFDPLFIGTLAFTAGLSLLVAGAAVAVAFPFAYAVTRLRRRGQVMWLVFLLTTLSLSEVLVTFSWQVMLARRIGIANLLVAVGWLSEPISLSPGFGAVLVALVHIVLPYTVLLLYPPLARLDRQLMEAAATMGAPPPTVFWTVVVPLMRGPLIAALLLVFIFTTGSFVVPMVLGLPEHWTLAILISKAALTTGNMPAAAAMSMFLVATTALLAGAASWLGRVREPARP